MKKIDKKYYKSVIYISHPFQNKQSNLDEIAEIQRVCTQLYPRCAFINPVACFSNLYDITTYKDGLNLTLLLLEEMADEMWIFGDYQSSKGCVKEIEYCAEYGIPYKHMNFESLKAKIKTEKVFKEAQPLRKILRKTTKETARDISREMCD